MSNYYVIPATESSAFQNNAPTSGMINADIASVQMPAGSEWLSPTARITRVFNSFTIGNAFQTTMAMLLEVDTPAAGLTDQSLDGTAAYIGQMVNLALATGVNGVGGSGDWSPATVSAWTQDANGALTWWSSGQAAVTQTQDNWPTLGGAVGTPENPLGPTVAGQTSPSPILPQLPGGGIDWSFLTTPAIIVGGGVLLWWGWPVLMGLRSGASALSAQAQAASDASIKHTKAQEQALQDKYGNPTRRRRRRRSASLASRRAF